MIIFIDTGVLGLLSSPNKRKEVIKSQEWLYFWLSRGFNIISSDICDYEVRRGTQYYSVKLKNLVETAREKGAFLRGRKP